MGASINNIFHNFVMPFSKANIKVVILLNYENFQ
jgi:hypothetical protein